MDGTPPGVLARVNAAEEAAESVEERGRSVLRPAEQRLALQGPIVVGDEQSATRRGHRGSGGSYRSSTSERRDRGSGGKRRNIKRKKKRVGEVDSSRANEIRAVDENQIRWERTDRRQLIKNGGWEGKEQSAGDGGGVARRRRRNRGTLSGLVGHSKGKRTDRHET